MSFLFPLGNRTVHTKPILCYPLKLSSGRVSQKELSEPFSYTPLQPYNVISCNI